MHREEKRASEGEGGTQRLRHGGLSGLIRRMRNKSREGRRGLRDQGRGAVGKCLFEGSFMPCTVQAFHKEGSEKSKISLEDPKANRHVV